MFYSQGNWEWSALQEKGMNADDLTMIPYYCGVDGEEKAGLNCGTPNPQVMPILQEWAQFYIRCQDEVTFRAMRRLAHPGPHETAVVSGESGASGLGGGLAEERVRLLYWK